jgi:acetyl-CoA synthetase
VCFVVTRPGITATETIIDEMIKLVAHKLGSTMKPEIVHIVQALPKTRSGKIVRSTIRRKYLGEPVGDLSSVDNPEAIDSLPVKTH